MGAMVSQLIYTAEKIIACFTFTMLVTCIIMTLVTILMLGIGIGYNYCFVDIKTKHRYVPSGIKRPGGKRIPFYPAQYSYIPRAAPPDITHQISTTESMLPLLESHSKSESNTTMQVTTNSTTTTDKTTEDSTEASTNSTSVHSTALMFIKSSTDITNADNSTETTTNSNGTTTDIGTSSNKDLRPELLEAMKGSSPSMIIPISGLDLIALLSKLRSENRNYSLQIVTS